MTSATSGGWKHWLSIVGLLAASAYLVHRLTPGSSGTALPSFDIYSYAYPMMITAADAVRHGGQGLLWNPLQECGQPFLSTGMTGVLSPPFLFALALDPDNALRAVLLFYVSVGTIGSYLLCREVGLSSIASVCGALAFGCSNAAVDLATSTPILSGPYAWMPLAMLLCERILRTPTLGASAGLAVVLTLALFPGHPQVLVFIYQVLALRVVFEMVSRRSLLGPRVLGFLFLGFALPPLLGAVHLLPVLEVMRTSVRSANLSISEIEGGGSLLTWELVQRQFAKRAELFNPVVLVLVMLASVAVCTVRARRHAVFYGIVALVCADLSMASNGYLFPLYANLPLARLFRAPDRFQWVLAFCVAMLVAIGVDTIVSPSTPGRGRWTRGLAGLALPAIAFGLLLLWTPNVGTLPGETLVVALVLGACAVATFVPRMSGLAGLALLAAVFLNVLVYRPTPLRTLLPQGSETLYSQASSFRELRSLMTPQDRIHVAARSHDFSLQQKTGSLFGVPALNDYQSLSTLRFANYFTTLRLGGAMQDLQVFYFVLGGMLPPQLKRPLLDLAAVRYVVVDETEDANATAIPAPRLQLVFQHSNRTPAPPSPKASSRATGETRTVADFLRIYENRQAFHRARWVSNVEVEPDPPVLLARLAAGRDNLATTALVEEPLSSGFRGDKAAVIGRVDFLHDDPEHIVLEVEARQRGFVVLADQWDAGWTATVDGKDSSILRANYLFRLVEVPEGKSIVEFRFFPKGLKLGILVSMGSAGALLLALFLDRRGRMASALP